MPKSRSRKSRKSPKRSRKSRSRKSPKRSRKSRSRKSRKSPKRSRKSRSRKSRKSPKNYVRTSKSKRSAYAKSCGSKKLKNVCESDPNCNWNKSRSKCYRGKRSIYAGPSMDSRYALGVRGLLE